VVSLQSLAALSPKHIAGLYSKLSYSFSKALLVSLFKAKLLFLQTVAGFSIKVSCSFFKAMMLFLSAVITSFSNNSSSVVDHRNFYM